MNNQKMSKNLSILSVILLVQCLLVIFLWLKPDAQANFKAEPLLNKPKDAIDRIVIGGDKPITLERKDQHWLMGDIPADPVKVDMLLDKLTSLQTAWPVATTDDAARRFEVADDKFQRKVEVNAKNSAVGTLYFGTSPAFNRTHVRSHGDKDIYSLAINIQDVLTTQDAWLHTSIMQPSGELKSIRSGGVEIEKVGDEWKQKSATPAPVEADKNAPEAKGNLNAKAMASALTQLNVLSVAENKAEVDAIPEPERVSIDAVTSTSQLKYQVLQSNGNFYIKRDDINHTYRISKSTYDELIKLANFAREQPKGS